ncbi:MAG: hypothetical protein H7235_07545 [Bdellovibrionaceae bacterium]|nr:hypothetical protein [Pseudobdellovibrionaceae bacterium]
MKNKRILLFSSACTYLCFLGLVLTLKKPLCIDSTVVQKIVRVTAEGKTTKTETAFSCNLSRPVDYSSELESYVAKISVPLDKTTALLNSIKPFKQRLQISIREDRPLMFQVSKNKINIGSSFLNLDYHLSRAVIKAWVAENKNSMKLDTTLFEESLTDFILYVSIGRIELEDPTDKIRTKLGSVKWPQVIKTAKGYCMSAWKYAEHAEECSHNFEDNNSDAEAAVYSLRPLLTSSIVGSYNELSMQQKSNLIQNIPKILSGMNLGSEKIIESMLVDSNPLHNGMLNINKFTNLILSSTLETRGSIYQLYTGITQHLQQYGVTDSFAEAYFDYLIEFNGQLSDHSAFYKALALAAVNNPEVQVAVKDANSIWILPSKTALPIKVFNQIQARQIVFMGCDNPKNIHVEQFFQKAEKLMLVNECDQTVDYNFESLFRDGIKGFIGKNHKFNFVQLHVPSLEMIKNDLAPSQNFFELVKTRDISRKEFKTLGWSKIQWKTDLHAYRPEAVIDAIEYFRN